MIRVGLLAQLPAKAINVDVADGLGTKT